MIQYQEFPKIMKHPKHAPAIWRQLEGKGTGLFSPDTICTQQERLPDVTVYTADDEKRYAARGYRPANNPDPSAYEQAILDAQPSCGYQFQAFPKYKYHAYELPKVVQNEAEEAALGAGWSDAPIMATEDDLIAYGAEKPDQGATLPLEAVETKAEEAERIDRRTRAYKQSLQENMA